MSAFKSAVPYKNGAFLLLLIIILLLVLISRNSHALVRAWVAQETSWKTAHFLQKDSEHFQIRYSVVDEDYVKVIEDTAEDAYMRVTNLFDYEPVEKSIIIVYPDSVSLAKSFGWEKDQGPYNQIEPAYNAIMDYAAANNYALTGVCYEFYLNDPADTPENELLTKIVMLAK
jgi:effector-binding domain-containing protein